MTNRHLPSIALSDLKKGDFFAIDDSEVLVFDRVEFNEYTGEARIHYTLWTDPRRIHSRLLSEVNDFRFTRPNKEN